MITIAYKMLVGNRAAFLGMIFGIFLAILLISQQSAIYLGLINRSYRITSIISLPDIWVIDPETEGEYLIRPLQKKFLHYVRSIPNIQWAVPINYTRLPLKTSSGLYKVAEIYGIDDQTLLGIPPLVKGNIEDIYREGAVIIDAHSAETVLATTLPNGEKLPLKIGDTLEINGFRAFIIGITNTIAGFFPEPIVFTTHSQIQQFSGSSRIQYIAAKARPGSNLKEILAQINKNKKVMGLTKKEFNSKIALHFLKTGILINYGIAILLGMIIGFSISGQIFYMMTMQNLGYYALIKTMGATEKTIFTMILFQAFLVGITGYILGTGATLLWGWAIKNTTLTFAFPGTLLLFTATLAALICAFISFISIRKIYRMEPHTIMTNL